MKLILWDIYEIRSEGSSLNGVMLRGRLRKLGLAEGFNILAENTEDVDNGVRFAIINSKDAERVIDYVHSVIEDATVEKVMSAVTNPVLSKLKVNIESRYEL